MRDLFVHFWGDESGATAIEYALIALFIGTAIISALTTIGTELREPFVAVGNGIKAATGN